MIKSRLLPAYFRAIPSIVLLMLAGFWAAPNAWAQASANPPERLAYQGYLVDANGAALATNAPKNYDVIFRIWNDSSATAAGNRLWTEQQTVTVDKGYFSVILGEGSSVGEPRPALSTIFTNATASDRWVAITVKGIGPSSTDVNILPRLRLLTSPYAFLASYASLASKALTVDGAALTTGTIPDARLGNNVALRTGGNTFSGNQVINNNLGIGTGSPGAKLHLSGDMKIDGANTLEFGAGVPLKDGNAGKIGYGTFTPNALDIVGGGTDNTSTRRLKFWAEGGSEFAGKVGIGTGSSSNKLSVAGSADFSGNVGIGISSPTNKLSVAGSADISGNVGIGTSTTTNRLSVGGSANFSGNVGIGVTNPASKLVVQGDAGANTYQLVVQGASNPNRQLLVSYHTTDNYGIIQPIEQGITFRNLALNPSGGNVGIGTTTPTQAKLQIAGSPNRTGSGLATYWAQQGVRTWAGGTDPGGPTAIYADGFIVGLGFISHSDERIKRVAGHSDAAHDLRTLMGIEVTDYSYVDTMAKGGGLHKKVLAQQVEKVFPQAVSRSTDVVPDIYQKATIKDGWVKLATNLKKGERVRLIGEKQEGIHTVLEVAADKFRTGFTADGDRVFVYGREVKDFRSVDYEAIAMLNVSATQELARKLAAREVELTELRAEMAKLRREKESLAQSVSDRDQRWEARLARLELALQEAATSSKSKAQARGQTREQAHELNSVNQ